MASPQLALRAKSRQRRSLTNARRRGRKQLERDPSNQNPKHVAFGQMSKATRNIDEDSGGLAESSRSFFFLFFTSFPRNHLTRLSSRVFFFIELPCHLCPDLVTECLLR